MIRNHPRQLTINMYIQIEKYIWMYAEKPSNENIKDNKAFKTNEDKKAHKTANTQYEYNQRQLAILMHSNH